MDGKERKYPLQKYNIWVGNYNLGQGYGLPTKPEMVGTVSAPNFKIACVLHELRGSLTSIESMIAEDRYVDEQSCRWFYNFDSNSNSWIGKYFETEAEALETF